MPEHSISAARERRDYERTASMISAALTVVGSSDLAMKGLVAAVKHTAKSAQQEMIAEWLKNYTAPGNSGNAFFKNIRHLHPNVRKHFVAGMMANFFMRDPELTKSLKDEYDVYSPTAILISPTMRCNLKCVGCFASEYEQESELTEEEVEDIITQGEAIGTRVWVMLGGEPFIWRPLLDVAERHPQSVFMVFTNSTLINDRMADRIVEVGNVCPVISIEGGRESTDARRGAGTFDRIMAAFDRLHERGAMSAFSATATSQNIADITSDEFADLMVEKGAFYGWYFLYMPIGREPDLSLMPSAEQRVQLHKGVGHIRDTRPLLVADFWGDGPLTGGCLSGGRKYLHINNKGDVEPCIFAHFAVDNIKEKSLIECLRSDFFKDLRRMAPYGKNQLLPCPIIDHPSVMRKAVERNGAYATHEGAMSLFHELRPGLQAYSAEVRKALTPVWEHESAWAHTWLASDPDFQRRLQRAGDADTLADEAGDHAPEEVSALN
jgi:MoaA/NifB/PqqE/SkfB family radical SAM enzyme